MDLLSYTPPPSVLVAVAALFLVYRLSIGRFRDRFRNSSPVKRVRQIAFYGGLAAALIALATPLDSIGDSYLFTAHMLQHLLLTLGVAPLLLLGTPGWLLRAALESTHLVGFARWARHPIVAFFSFNAVFTLAHIPAIYELTLANEPLHALEHLVFVATAMLMWMPVLSPVPDVVPPYPPLGQVLYLFLQTIPASLLGALLAATSSAYYPTYVRAARITALNAVEDQQLGGLIMWVGGAVYYLIASGVVFFAWASREEAANRRPVEV